MLKKITGKNKIWKDLDKLSKFNFLWIIDLSNNLIECVKGLSGFVCLGTLNLSNNRIGWLSLESIKHLFIIDLKLHCNPCLEEDIHYRHHLVDMFSRVFCLDGKFINATERVNTEIFFDKSNFDDKPVRRHTKLNSFRPSSTKNLRYYCNINEEGFQLLSQFPDVIPLIEEWDKKKVKFYTDFVFNQINNSANSQRWLVSFIDTLLSKLYDVTLITELYMITTLFMANIEFGLTEKCIQEALIQNKLNFINFDQCQIFLSLQNEYKLLTVTAFLAVLSLANNQSKIQKEFMMELYHAINNIMWIKIRLKSLPNLETLYSTYKIENLRSVYNLSKSLVAAEAFMLVYNSVNNAEEIQARELNHMINNATGQSDFLATLSLYSNMIGNDEIMNIILNEIRDNIDRILASSNLWSTQKNDAVKKRSISTEFAQRLKNANDNLCRGYSSVTESLKVTNYDDHNKKMEIGEKVLLGSQILATVLSIPESNSALVQVIKSPSMGFRGDLRNQSKKGFMKIDKKFYIWNVENGCWIPENSVGDKIFIYQNYSSDKCTSAKECYKKKLTVEVSKIELSDECILQDNFNEEKRNNNKSITEIQQNQDFSVHPSTRNSSPKSTSRLRKLVTPNLAKFNFSATKDCTSVTQVTTDVFTNSSNSFQRVSKLSKKIPTPKDATMWLGNGDYVYKSVWWHSKNPSNIKKRYRLPKWLNDK